MSPTPFTALELQFLMHAAGVPSPSLTRPGSGVLTGQGVLVLRAKLEALAAAGAQEPSEDFGPLARWKAAPTIGKHLGCLATYDDGSGAEFFAPGEGVKLSRGCRIQPVFSGPCVTDYARMRAACAEAETRLAALSETGDAPRATGAPGAQ